jgi:low affinity Fe/Cu permease
MNSALVKTEHIFLQGYNLFVKQKEAKMKELVDKFKERNTSLSLKDEKINKLEKCIYTLKNQLFYSEQQKEKKIEEIMRLKENEQMLINENKFL